MSIISIASRGFLLSHSLNTATFIFNFLCFIADVLSVFCIVSWLFFVPAGKSPSFVAPFLPTLPLHNIYSLIWSWTGLVLIVMVVITGVLCLIVVLYMVTPSEDDNNDRCETALAISCIALFCLILLFPALVVLEAVALSLVPIFIMNSLSNPYSKSPVTFRRLHAFLQGAYNKKDFKLRGMVANRVIALEWLSSLGATPANNWTLSIQSPGLNRRQREALKIVKESEDIFLRVQNGEDPAYVSFRTQLMDFKEHLKLITGYRKSEMVICCYVGLLLFPTFVLASVYNLIYPFLCFFHYPYHEIGPLQKVLSLALFSCLASILLLSVPVHRYRRLTNAVRTFDRALSISTAAQIEKNYKELLDSKRVPNAVRCVVLVCSTRATKDMGLHVKDLLPPILQFAGLGEKHSMDMTLFANSSIFKQLTSDDHADLTTNLSPKTGSLGLDDPLLRFEFGMSENHDDRPLS